MNFSFCGWVLEADSYATRAFYAVEPGEGCDCLGCRNYAAAAKDFSPAVCELFAALGIDPLKPIEVCLPYCESLDGAMHYDAWYHLRGSILSRPDSDCLVQVEPGFEIRFSAECDLLSEDFPSPAVQLNVTAQLPWLLDKHIKQDYLIQ